jgi:hypothetical protein
MANFALYIKDAVRHVFAARELNGLKPTETPSLFFLNLILLSPLPENVKSN